MIVIDLLKIVAPIWQHWSPAVSVWDPEPPMAVVVAWFYRAALCLELSSRLLQFVSTRSLFVGFIINNRG